MAKRVNPYRRAAAQAALVRQMAHDATVKANADTTYQGRVRSPLNPVIQLTGYSVGRPIPWEGRGKVGKVVRGRFKPTRPGTKSRFASK